MRRIVYTLFCLLSVALSLVGLKTVWAGTSTPPTWLNDKAVQVTKLSDLTANKEPFSMGIDCVPTDFPTGRTNSGSLHHGCVTDELFGSVGDGYLLNGPQGTLAMQLSTRGYFLPRSAHGSVTFSPSPVVYGVAIQVGNKVVSNPKFVSAWGLPPKEYYTYEVQPEKTLSDDSGRAISFELYSPAYSRNGEWMAAMTYGGGIRLYDTATFQGKTIAWKYGYMSYGETKANNIAISDDGRYVAINSNLAAPGQTPIPTLRVYDTSTCADQAQYESNQRASTPCKYKDVWSGTYGNTSYGGVVTEHPELEYPRHVRFAADGSLTFDSVYARTSATAFSVAHYSIPFGGSVVEPIRLLALGDSYISGEGAYSYRDGTDTSNNKCHQSTVSYPYLLGESFATEYHSAACSGAVTGNIVGPKHPNQLNEQILQNKYTDLEIDNIVSIGEAGVVEQIKYLPRLKPNTILLSIGGNDIGFGAIVKRCVLTIAGNACYKKHSERLSLLKTIYSKHKVLTDTYTKILSESTAGTKLYVIGYPDVINQTGNCGVNVHLDDQERRFATMLIDRLNATLQNAAASAGAFYVDTTNALDGHRLCDTTDDGVNGLTGGDDTVLPIPVKVKGMTIFTLKLGLGKESYHPTSLGHRLLATAIAKATDDLRVEPKAPSGAKQLSINENDPFVTLSETDTADSREIVYRDIVNAPTNTPVQSVDIVCGEGNGVAPNAPYTIVAHSEEVILATGVADADGRITAEVNLPTLTPGAHSIHIYTTDVNNEAIDITEDIFVAASAEDYDGDGIQNVDDNLPLVNDTEHIIMPEPEQASQNQDGEDKTPIAQPKTEESVNYVTETINQSEISSSQSASQPKKIRCHWGSSCQYHEIRRHRPTRCDKRRYNVASGAERDYYKNSRGKRRQTLHNCF